MVSKIILLSYDGFVFFNQKDKEQIDEEWESAPGYLFDDIVEKILRSAVNDELKLNIQLSSDKVCSKFRKTSKYVLTEYESDERVNKYRIKDWRGRSEVYERLISIVRSTNYEFNILELTKSDTEIIVNVKVEKLN